MINQSYFSKFCSFFSCVKLATQIAFVSIFMLLVNSYAVQGVPSSSNLNTTIQISQNLDNYIKEPTIENFKELLQQISTYIKANPEANVESLKKINPSFVQLGCSCKLQTVSPSFKFKIWQFVNSQQSNYALLEIIKSNKPKKNIVLNFLVELPNGYNFKNANFYPGSNSKYTLIVYGLSSDETKTYLKSYELSDYSLSLNPKVLEALPPNIYDNFKILANLKPQTIDMTFESLNKSQPTNSYKLSLYWINDRFSFNPQISPDSPEYPASEFMTALGSGNEKYARSWLKDQSLIYITKYAHILQKPGSLSRFRLVKVGSIKNSVRFTIITNSSDDLSVDIQKIKGKWFVVSLFLVPGDKFLKQLTN